MSYRRGCLVLLCGIAALLTVPAPVAAQPPRVDAHGDALPPGALARLGTVRFRHDAPVQSVRFSPDGRTVLGSSADGPGARLWEAATGKPLIRFENAPAFFRPVISPDNKLVADIGADYTARVWDLGTGKVVRSWDGEAWGFVSGDVQFAADGKLLVVRGARGGVKMIRRFDLTTGKELRRQDATLGVEPPLVVCPDGRRVIGRLENGQPLALFDLDTGAKLHEFEQSEAHRTRVPLLSPDGKTLLGVEEKQSRASIWDVATGKLIRRLGETRGLGFPRKEVFSPDGKRVALLEAEDASVLVFEVTTGKRLAELDADSPHHSHTFSPDGTLLAASADNNTVGVWEVATGKRVCQFAFEPGSQQTGADVAFAPDGRTLAIATGHRILLGDVTTGKEVTPATGHQEPPASLAFSPDGNTVASAGGDRVVCLWDAATGKELRRLTRIRDVVLSLEEQGRPVVAFTRAGLPLVAVRRNDSVILRDVRTGKELHRFTSLKKSWTKVAFDGDAGLLVAANVDGEVHVWDTATGKARQRLTWFPPDEAPTRFGEHDAPEPAFAPDSRCLAVLGRPRPLQWLLGNPQTDPYKLDVRLWEVATGKERGRFAFDERTTEGFTDWIKPKGDSNYPPSFTLTFSADGKTVAVGCRHSLYLCELSTGKEVRRFSRPGLVAGSTVFSPDGKLLAALDDQGRVSLWEVVTATLVGQFHCQAARAVVLAFAPDGKRLATGGSDTTVVIWDVAALVKPGAPGAGELDGQWAALADADAAKAFRAVNVLAAHPRDGVALLKKGLLPPVTLDAKRIGQLLAELDDGRFAVREQAMRQLEKLAEAAEPALKQALAEAKALEVRRRIEQLLHRMDGNPSPQMLRELRAVEALEQIASAEARQVLQALAQGMPGYRTTEAADAALRRLALRPAR
jgi:WD40 repeat protein